MTATTATSFSGPLESGSFTSTPIDHAVTVKLAASSYPAIGDFSALSPTPTAYSGKFVDMTPASYGSWDSSKPIASDAAVKATASAAPDTSASPDDIRGKLDKASSVNFTSAADDAKNGVKPDYILGEDGKLRANPDKTEPNKDGSVNIEVESKNKSEVQAKQYADKLQKAAIKDLISYFQQSHPKGRVPQDWLDQLAKEPDLPPAPVPISNNRPSAPDVAPPQPAPRGEAPAPREAPATPQREAPVAAPQMQQQPESSAPAPQRSPGGGPGGSPGGGPSGPPGGAERSPEQAPAPTGGGPRPNNDGMQPPPPGSDSSQAPIPNMPDMATSNPDSVMGNQLLTAGQQAFVSEFAKKTGLDTNVVGAWVLNEESGSAARNREAHGNMNWLNIGYTDTAQRGTKNDFWYNDPIKAADVSAAWMKGEFNVPGFGKSSHGIREIAATAGHSPSEQLAAIHHSGWASGGYGQMHNLYANVVRHNVPENELAANKPPRNPHGDVKV